MTTESNIYEVNGITISEKALIGLLAVRKSGEVNMIDRRGVMVVANNMAQYHTVVWLQEQGKNYGMFLLSADLDAYFQKHYEAVMEVLDENCY